MVTDEQITLYAIGAMDAREAADFERQVAASADLRKRVAEEKAATSAFLLSTPPVAPPPALKNKVMAQIGADIAKQAMRAQPAPRVGARDVWRYLLGGLSAAFAALALVFGLNWYNTQAQLAQVRNTLSDVQAQVLVSEARTAQLTNDLAQARADLDQAKVTIATTEANASHVQTDLAVAQAKVDQASNELVMSQRELSVLHQNIVRTTALPASKAGFESGAIHVFYSPDGKTALITVTNLPKLSADKTYQVWLIKGNERLPSNVFNVGEDGTGRLVVQSNEPFSAFQNLGVTIEPAGGRPTPNPEGPIYLGALG